MEITGLLERIQENQLEMRDLKERIQENQLEMRGLVERIQENQLNLRGLDERIQEKQYLFQIKFFLLYSFHVRNKHIILRKMNEIY